VHELAVAQAIVGAAERHADGRPVTIVRVGVGRLRQVVPEYLTWFFEIAAKETLCEGASLECERLSSLLRCAACGAEWDPAPPPAPDQASLIVGFRCPECGGGDHQVVSGDELVVESIDVREEASADPADLAGS
jgi:hydrogenase nickel incorporation protein HypA/HybF